MPRLSRPVRHGRKWRVRWTDHTGARQSAVFATYRAAELERQRRVVEVDAVKRGERTAPPAERTFAELCDYWLAYRAPRKRSQKNDEGMIRNHLRPAFGSARLPAVTTERVDAFAGTLSLATNTVHNLLTLLVSMLRVAHDLGWLLRCPVIRKPKLQLLESDFRYLRSQVEIDRFVRAAEGESAAVFAMYATALYSGMRAGELAALRWTDIDFERRLICCQRSYKGPTKSGTLRWIPILDPLLPILREWRLQCPFEIVFPNERGRPHTQSSRVFQECFARVLDRAGFPRGARAGRSRGGYIRFHDLRHTFASHWMMNGGDLFRLQKVLGHSEPHTTMRYAHLAPQAFSEDYARLGLALASTPADVTSITAAENGSMRVPTINGTSVGPSGFVGVRG